MLKKLLRESWKLAKRALRKIGSVLVAHGASSFFHALLVVSLTWVGYWWWGHDGAMAGFGAGIFFYFMKEFGVHHDGRAGDFWRALHLDIAGPNFNLLEPYIGHIRLSPVWVKVADSCLDFGVPVILGYVNLTLVPQ